jgi:putative ABC transport system permease protein
MFTSYIKSALRSLWKKKTFSLINILGLSIGIAACLLILHHAAFELSFDRFHENADRLYRLRGGDRADSCFAVGQAVKDSFPEVLDFAKIARTGARGIYSSGELHVRQENVFSATGSFLSLFSYKMSKGDPATALAEPNSIVITESTAKTYFGHEDPMGKVLRHNGAWDYKITGILADLPKNSHLKFDILLSWATIRSRYGEKIDSSWVVWGVWTYILLKPGTDPPAFQAKLTDFIKAKQKEINQPESFWEQYHIQPLKDIHLNSAYVYESAENGSGNAVRLLMIVAAFIVVIAWSNYINLSTALGAGRAKEVGIRKVSGAGRRHLIRQFLVEASLVNAAATGLAVLLVQLSLPAFSRLTGTPPEFIIWHNIWFWAALLAVFLGGIFLSGLYPAFILSGFQPAAVLREKLGPSSRGVLLRKGLVVFQFMISAALIAGTFTVYKQISFMTGSDLGLDYRQTLVLRRPMAITDKTREEFAARVESCKAELQKIPGVSLVSISTSVPGDDVGPINEGKKPDLPKEATVDVYEIAVDQNFIPMYGLKLAAGRNFSEKMKTDATGIILNETAIKRLGYGSPEAAVDQKYIYRNTIPLTIVGVMADYHQESLKTNYEPLALVYRPAANGDFSVRYQTKDVTGMVAGVKNVWDRFFPGNPFEVFFLDDHLRQLYRSDWRFLNVFGIFSLLAIFVACLGLFGLSLFNTVQRTKEIGIRKVLGASLVGLIVMLLKDFVKLLVLAVVIAIPVFYFSFKGWLNRYAFRIGIEWWFFIIPLIVIFAISTLVVVIHSIKVSESDPVRSLRYE